MMSSNTRFGDDLVVVLQSFFELVSLEDTIVGMVLLDSDTTFKSFMLNQTFGMDGV